jgi:hypothetical protein
VYKSIIDETASSDKKEPKHDKIIHTQDKITENSENSQGELINYILFTVLHPME